MTAKPKTKLGRLYVKGTFTGYKRGHRNQHENTALLRIEGVEKKKKLASIWEKDVLLFTELKTIAGRKEKKPNHLRVIWGKVTRPHGNSGAVRAQFRRNLPSKAIGRRIRIMLYPSSI